MANVGHHCRVTRVSYPCHFHMCHYFLKLATGLSVAAALWGAPAVSSVKAATVRQAADP